jgi:hypothetical protein
MRYGIVIGAHICILSSTIVDPLTETESGVVSEDIDYAILSSSMSSTATDH